MEQISVLKWLEVSNNRAWVLDKLVHYEALLKDVGQYPDDYMYERTQLFEGSKSGIEAALKRLGMSQKNTLDYPKPCLLKRAKYQSKLGHYIVQGFAIVHMNGSGFESETLRSFGYATIDKHCIDSYDWQGKKRTDVIGAFEPAQDCWRINILWEYCNENAKVHSWD